MNDFNNEFNNEKIETETTNEIKTEENPQDTYSWTENCENVMSGTVAEKRALSVYRPKVKKRRMRNPLIAAVVASVVTACICCGIFSAVMVNVLPKTMSDSATGSGYITNSSNSSGVIKPIVNSLGKDPLSVPDVYAKASPSVVSIFCGNDPLTTTSSGSGIILSEDGYVVTNNHVIENAYSIRVKTIAGQNFEAELVGADAKTDIAVLKVSSEQKLPAAEMGDSSNIRVGDMAFAIGNPLQEELVSTLTVGYISAIDRTMVIDDRQMTMIQTDAAINPGNSGGALINAYGQVIGITTAKSTGYDVEGLGFAIPTNEAVPIIDSIIKHGYVTGRPLVGITGIDVNEKMAEANGIPVGVYVNSVVEDGAADKGGIKKGDVIVKCEGKEIKSVDDINEIRDSHAVGDKLTFVVHREGREVKCTVTLQEEKPTPKTEEAPQEQPENYRPYSPSDFFSFFGW